MKLLTHKRSLWLFWLNSPLTEEWGQLSILASNCYKPVTFYGNKPGAIVRVEQSGREWQIRLLLMVTMETFNVECWVIFLSSALFASFSTLRLFSWIIKIKQKLKSKLIGTYPNDFSLCIHMSVKSPKIQWKFETAVRIQRRRNFKFPLFFLCALHMGSVIFFII